jgi:replicative DNA helicase
MDNIENNRKPNVRIKNPSLLTGDIGKIPPQAIDIEQVVLGAMMLEKEPLNDTINIISKECFYDPRHQFIYAAMHELFANTKPVDLITVTNRLQKNGELEAAGGVAYISQLTNRVASSAHIEFHARILAEKFIKRELIKVSSEIIRDSFDETTDVFEVLNKAESNLFQIAMSVLLLQKLKRHEIILMVFQEHPVGLMI